MVTQDKKRGSEYEEMRSGERGRMKERERSMFTCEAVSFAGAAVPCPREVVQA